MGNKFKLKYSQQFYNDLDQIVSYIKYELNNVIAAQNLLNKVEKSIKYRFRKPLGFEKYKTNSGNTYYRIYINNYVVFYTVSDDAMEIRRIIYNKRNIDKLL